MRRPFAALPILVFLVATNGRSQTFSGSVLGTVKDSAGQIVPGAQIVLTNLDTNQARTTITSELGTYIFPLVPPGRYRLEMELSGFKKFVREPIEVEVQRKVTIDVELQLGQVTELVEVTATTPVVESTASSLGEVIDNKKVIDLPLNGRNTMALVSLTAGVVPQGFFEANPAVVNYTAWGNFSANGSIANANEVLMDGTPVTQGGLNGVGFLPPIDAVQEFKVQTNNFSAEFGRTAGAVVNTTFKMGTNEVHGTVYEFFRNKVLDANDFFNNSKGTPRAPFTFNQFGGTVGGPIVIPGVYDGRSRSFFFGNYEGFRQRQGIAFLETVPTLQQRQGDFSRTFNRNGELVGIFDPLTTRPDPGAPGRFVRDPFPGNVIPPSRFDAVSANYVKLPLWAEPNVPGDPLTAINNFSTNAGYPIDQDQFTVRFDHNLTSKQRAFIRASYYKIISQGIDPFKNRTTLVDFGAPQDHRGLNLSINDVYTFSPTLLAELRYGFLRFDFTRLPASFGQDLTALGFPASLNASVPYQHIPWVTVAGIRGLDASTGSTILRIFDTHSWAASLTKITGRHTIKVGTDIRLFRVYDVQSNNGSGNFSFDGRFTSSDPLRVTETEGVGFASFLLGFPAGGGLLFPERLADSRYYYAVYLQDDFKVSQRLTLNLGLRWDLDTPYTERYDRLTFLDISAPSPITVPGVPPLAGAFKFVNSPEEESRFQQDVYWKQWAPRFGFAYSLTEKTVLRGGYGIFWIPFNLVTPNTGSNNPAFSINTPFVSSLDGGLTPADRLSNPFPNGILRPPGRSVDFNRVILGQGFGALTRDDHTGYVQQWNFNVQRELPGSWLLDAAYAGNHAAGLPVTIQLNQLPLEHMTLGARLNEQVPNPFFGVVNVGTLSRPTVAFGQLLRPYPQFDGVSLGGRYAGSSTYHSAQIKVDKRFAKGFSFLMSYTIGKVISDGEAATGWLEFQGSGGGYQNHYNRRAERSLSSFDVPQRAVVNYILDLPFGTGKPLLNNLGTAGSKIASGWQVNGITTFQSGTPLFLSTSSNITNSFGGGSRPNQEARSAKLSGDAHKRLDRWFETSAFSQPPAFTFGNSSRILSDVRGHGINNFDISVFKNTRFGPEERYNVQFRAEFFNIWNRVRFRKPGNTLGTAQFGVINGQENLPRQIQFALKFIF